MKFNMDFKLTLNIMIIIKIQCILLDKLSLDKSKVILFLIL
jgi:hypothetical protein